jgi:hypothetical protein
MDAFELYRSADYAATLDEWPDDFKPASPIQTLVLAHTHAELGQPECLKLIDAAEPQFPVEAAAMRVIYHARAAHHGEAIRAQEQLVERLEKNPWVVRRIAESAIARAIDVAKAEPSLAPRLFALLSRPFASGCLEYRRALSRAQVATKLGPEQVVEAFSVFEPHIPWAEDFLAARTKAYAEVSHPLAGRAERDLQWFKRHQPPK